MKQHSTDTEVIDKLDQENVLFETVILTVYLTPVSIHCKGKKLIDNMPKSISFFVYFVSLNISVSTSTSLSFVVRFLKSYYYK